MPDSRLNEESSNFSCNAIKSDSNLVNNCIDDKINDAHESIQSTIDESGEREIVTSNKLSKPNSISETVSFDDSTKDSAVQNEVMHNLASDHEFSTKKEKCWNLAEDFNEKESVDLDQFANIVSPIKLKEKISDNLSEEANDFLSASVDNHDKEKLTGVDLASDTDSPIKMKKKFKKSDDLLKDADKLASTEIAVCNVEEPTDPDQNSDVDSPIKIKRKKVTDPDLSSDADSPIKIRKKFRRFSNDLDDDTDVHANTSINDQDGKVFTHPDQSSDADSPIKLKRKFRKFSDGFPDDTDVHANTSIDDQDGNVFTHPDQSSDADSPIKLKRKFRKFSDDFPDDADVLASTNTRESVEKESADGDLISDTDSSIMSKVKSGFINELENTDTEFGNSETNCQAMEESFLNEMNENSNSLDNDESPMKKRRNDYIRDVKGKELMRQALSLPYFQLPKPDFREYMNETDKRLEEPLLKIAPDSSQNLKLSNKITLKPTDSIVFEIGPPRMDRVEPFRKKVLHMMSRRNGLKSDSTDKGAVNQNSVPKPIGAERLSWKMKLLNDIAKKKEAALRERNEMLEEVLEVNEENQNMESETEDLIEDDAAGESFPVSDTVASAADEDNDSLPEITTTYQDHPLNMNNVEKPFENNKEIESSPLCFSLPSFQPEGGFRNSEDQSTSIVSDTSQINLSFNESESQKENHSLSLFGSSDLLSSNPLPPISQNDEVVYDKVLAKENLLSSKHNISRDMITADIVDICSGQFPDEEELPKTPPLISMSAEDEESDDDVSDSNCPTFQPEPESDSESEDELHFKRKVINKKIRPISPIDDESRYGEEDTRIHPASVLLEANSNFNFSKNESEHSSDFEGDDNQGEVERDQQNLNYDSEESLIDDAKEVLKAPKNVRDYFENEAELSGEEGSSDEDENDMDGEDPLMILDDGEIPANDELRDQIGTLHLKHLLDDDDRMIRQVKDHFLEDGELFSDAARQRKFNWSFNQVEAIHNPNSSDSENEEEISETPFHGDKIKWMQENGNKENEDETDHSFDTSFKVGVRKKIVTQIVADRLMHSFNKRPRNSFLDEEEAKKSFKKIKLDVTNAQGSRVTKNFVFVEANENGSVKKKVQTNPKNSIDNSVFDLI